MQFFTATAFVIEKRLLHLETAFIWI